MRRIICYVYVVPCAVRLVRASQGEVLHHRRAARREEPCAPLARIKIRT